MKQLLTFVVSLSLAGCCCKSREEKLKAAEEAGDMAVSEKARVVKGMGNALDKEGTGAGEAIGKGATKVLKSIGGGAMEGLNELAITTSPELTTAGLKAERANIAAIDGKQNQVKVYVVFDKAYKGDLTLILRDKANREAGRAKVTVDEPVTGKYVLFPFDPLTEWMGVAGSELK